MPTDFAVIITLGSVTAQSGNRTKQYSRFMCSCTTYLRYACNYNGYLHIKSVWVRKLTNSEPVTAIKNGRIIDKNLKRVRFTVNELTTLLREKNIFNYTDVEFAIIENDGQLSVLPKSQKAPLTPTVDSGRQYL